MVIAFYLKLVMFPCGTQKQDKTQQQQQQNQLAHFKHFVAFSDPDKPTKLHITFIQYIQYNKGQILRKPFWRAQINILT